jgi:DNA repair exonuclease SbcCD ATPase subunit
VDDTLWEDNMPLFQNLMDRTHDAEEAARAALEAAQRLEAHHASLMRRAREAEEAAEMALATARRLEGHHALRKAYAEDRLARLEGAIRALARRVKALEAALHAHAQAQAEDRAQDRARRLEMAKVELEDLAPRVFAKRGGDTDVLVAADHLRGLLAQGHLEEVEPVLARWKAEVGG